MSEEVQPHLPKPPHRPPPSAHVHHDRWTVENSLGFDLYAHAIAEFIRHKDSKPPFTIGIQAPWGQGKTSLMRMVQKRLDPEHPHLVEDAETPRQGCGSTQGHEGPTSLTLTDLKEWFEKGDVPLEVPKLKGPTVWFNPWKYQSSEEIWSGLAHSILSQLTERLGKRDREMFWLKLQLKRIDSKRLCDRGGLEKLPYLDDGSV